LNRASARFLGNSPSSKLLLMAYSVVSNKTGKTYYLHVRLQKLKGGQEVPLYFFAGQLGDGALDELPAGRVVSESEKTGLPFLKKA